MIDLAKLRICQGVIHYRLRQQDGTFIAMTIANSLEARLFVSWLQIHD